MFWPLVCWNDSTKEEQFQNPSFKNGSAVHGIVILELLAQAECPTTGAMHSLRNNQKSSAWSCPPCFFKSQRSNMSRRLYSESTCGLSLAGGQHDRCPGSGTKTPKKMQILHKRDEDSKPVSALAITPKTQHLNPMVPAETQNQYNAPDQLANRVWNHHQTMPQVFLGKITQPNTTLQRTRRFDPIITKTLCFVRISAFCFSKKS